MTSHPHLDAMRKRHRELDSRIFDERKRPGASDAEITQMKRTKLRLKEAIVQFETAAR